MADDHYVAQTYLRRFADRDGRLNAYRKDGKAPFRPWPQDICHEWNGDQNPMLPDRPEFLGDIRSIFEPEWNKVVECLSKRETNKEIRFLVALCFAHMMTCVPAWYRVMLAVTTRKLIGDLEVEQALRAEQGVVDPDIESAVAMIKAGELLIKVDPDFVKAQMSLRIFRHASFAYHSDWLFLENKTDIPFLISDNPVAMEYVGDPAAGAPLKRIMSITPHLALTMTFSRAKLPKAQQDMKSLLETEPAGSIEGMHPSPREVREFNRLISQCAERFVFSNRQDDGVGKLVEKYSQYRLENEYKQWRLRDGTYRTGHIVLVRPRTYG